MLLLIEQHLHLIMVYIIKSKVKCNTNSYVIDICIIILTSIFYYINMCFHQELPKFVWLVVNVLNCLTWESRNLIWLKINKAPLTKSDRRNSPEKSWFKCDNCEQIVYYKDFQANQFICTICHKHYPIKAGERLLNFLDPNS